MSESYCSRSFVSANAFGSPSLAVLHIYAAIAQQERELISRRTKEALAAAKERGVRLGRPTRSATLQQPATRPLAPVLRETIKLSAQKAANEIERRGLGKISFRTVMRARVRLGLG